MNYIWIFLITILAPVLVIRLVIHKIANPPQETIIIRGVRFHHLHLGILLTFIAALILVFSGANFFSVGFLGSGLGLILDEFIASLLVPHQEPLSTQLYLKSLPGTIILFAAITIILLTFFFVLQTSLI